MIIYHLFFFMKNILSAINYYCSRFFVALTLTNSFSQDVFGGKKEQQIFIDFVLQSDLVKKNELVRKAFSQPLESMGKEKSPLMPEIIKWQRSCNRTDNITHGLCHYVNYDECSISHYGFGSCYDLGRSNKENFKLFEAIFLKAILGLLGDEWQNCQQRKIYLTFEDQNYFHKEKSFFEARKAICTDYLFIFWSTQQNNIKNKEEKLNFFLKKFNIFSKNFYPDSEFLEDEFSACEGKKNFNYYKIIQKILNEQDEEIKKYFSDNFFINFNRILFSSLTTAEYIFISNMFLHNISTKFENYSPFRKTLLSLFQKESNEDGLPQDFCFDIPSCKGNGDYLTITKKNLEDMIDNLFFPLQSYFVFNYYSLNVHLNAKYLENLMGEDQIDKTRYQIIANIKNFYKNKAFDDLCKLFFMSFWGHSCDRFLENFDFRDYLTFIYKINKKIKNYKNKMEKNKEKTYVKKIIHKRNKEKGRNVCFKRKNKNIYGTKTFLNFLYLNTYFGGRKELIVGNILPFIIGNERHDDLMMGLPQETDLQRLKRSIECLRFSVDIEDQLLQTFLAERIIVLREKIKLFQEREAFFYKKNI